MTEAAPSYAHGTSSVALLGETIGRHFDRTVARWGDRPGADRLPAGRALELSRAGRAGRCVRRRTDRAGPEAGRAHRHLVAEQCRMGGDAVRHREGRADPGEHQSGVPAGGAGIRAEQGRLPRAGHRDVVQDQRLCRHDQHAGAGTAARASGPLDAAKLPSLRIVIQIGADTAPGAIPFDSVYTTGGASERAQLAELAGKLQFDEPINIQFTSGTTGLPKGATLTHHNILNNGYFLGEAMAYTEQDKVCIPVPLYHCFGMVIGNLACITHGSAMVLSRRGLRSARDVAGGGRGALHVAVRRADHVHRRTRPSGLRQVRSDEPAHRHDGRRALPDRGDAPLHPRHAPDRDDHRLRHDGDQPGQHADGAGRSAGTARLDGRDACIRMWR